MTENPERGGIADTCFIAVTRPAMMLGVSAEALIYNLGCSVIVSGWLGLGSWKKMLYMAALIPSIHMIQRYAFARDHNWFRIFKLGIEGKGFGTVRWGGSSWTPIPATWPRKAKDLSVGI
jgi:type IV secretory pathway VirB3-like protein